MNMMIEVVLEFHQEMFAQVQHMSFSIEDKIGEIFIFNILK